MKPLDIYKKAQAEGYAIGQFNITTDEQLKAIVEVAKELKAPIIIGTSESERKFIGTNQVVALVESWQEQTDLPIILNADHCHDFDSAKEAIDAGYSAIHFDGSNLPYKENVKITKQVVDYARAKDKDIVVEGELGYLRGGSEVHKEKTKIEVEDLTKPEEAKNFVSQTGIDSLAVVIGNMHGVESGMKNPPLFIDRLAEIQKAVPEVLLVLHGGSGTPEKDIEEAIKLGVVKININTELRVAYSEELEETIKENPDEVKPYKILAPAVEATKEVVAKKIKFFGSDNKL